MLGGACKETSAPMAQAFVEPSSDRALLQHVALCFEVASGLGFIAAAINGFELDAFVGLSRTAHYPLAILCIAACFLILWCAPDGPERWRPFVLPDEAREFIFGCAALVILLGGLAAFQFKYLS